MDNAANALIIAATVLIAIMVLSIGVYTAIKVSKVSQSYEQERQTEELIKFNSRFTVFQDRSDISAQEIVTLKNYVEKYNEENDPDISLNVYGSNTGIINTDKIEFIKRNSTVTNGGHEELITFTCGNKNGTYVNKGVLLPNGKVTEINFTKNT